MIPRSLPRGWRTSFVSAGLVSLILGFPFPASSAPLITEFMADNETVLADEDGEFSDWIEIHNPDATPVDLDGYFLTDNAGDLNKWRVPAVTLEPGAFLIVFASNKDRAVPGGELHTNFAISANGEYLALVAPDSTVLSDFGPSFPLQDPDRSFGRAFDGTSLVREGDDADIRVPLDGSLGTSWTAPAFDSSGWLSGPTGAGYGVSVPGMRIRDVQSAGSPMTDLAAADSLLAGNGVASEVVVIASFMNYLDTGGDGHFGNNQILPNGSDRDNFVVEASGTLVIPTGGQWTFGLNSDDGGRIRINGSDVMVDNTRHAPADHFGTVTLAAGSHTFEAMFFENGGGAGVEFFAAPGSFTTFNGGFRLVGDTANGGLATFTAPDAGGGAGTTIGTNLSAVMDGSRPSAYLRIPFEVPDLAALESLALSMRYNDGFVAYLNGVEVAARNAPASPLWSSTATASRTSSDSVIPQVINLTASAGLLQDGAGNVLAIHGMNFDVDDGSFLVLPELTGGGLLAGPPVYFDGATPGSINGPPSSLGKVADTSFSPDRGFYPNAEFPTGPLQVTIETATEGATIRYTTDGSPPSATRGTVYTGPVTVGATTTLRAIATKNGYDPTNVDTHTYLFLDDVIVQQANGAPPAGWPASPVNGQVLDYGMDPAIVNSSNPAIGGADRVKAALTSLPTLSVATEQDGLTGETAGIYTHAGNRGFAWERPASMELIFPEGYVDPDGNTEGFQVDMGIRIRGGFSRSGNNPKHSFRLFFRSDYGHAKLKYPMFGDEGVDEFDNLDLRGPQNYSWAFGGDSRNSFVRDVWSRDLQLELGSPSTRSRYYHLYLNGIYWGVVQTEERPEASFGESYLGGEKEDYDVVKSFGDVTDGNRDAYQRLWERWQAGFSNNAAYFAVLGKNPDGTDNPALEKMVDQLNLIDYMIITYYTGDRDGPGSRYTQPRPNNYFGLYNRTNPDGWKFVEHDSEHSLGTGDHNMITPRTSSTSLMDFNPHTLHEGLMANVEYRTAFADRVQELLFNNGPMTGDNGVSRIDRRAAQIDAAVTAHSARWGDAKREPPLTRNDWLSAVEGVRNFIRGRAPVLVSQLQAEGWFPSIVAPTFSQHGGYLNGGRQIALSSPAGTIYYRADGGDPRLPGGALAPQADIFIGTQLNDTYVDFASGGWRYLDNGSEQGSAWRATSFDHSAWKTGTAPLGYGDPVNTQVLYGPNPDNAQNNPIDKFVTTYFRHELVLADPSEVETLFVDLVRDDAAAVYLNGTEILRSNLPAGPIDSTTGALSAAGGGDETAVHTQEVDPGLLVPGTNIVAAEVHQVIGSGGTVSSSDLRFDLRLRAVRTVTQEPIELVGPAERTVISRTRSAGGEWSAATTATFFVDLFPASPANLAITEIHYRPADATPDELAAGFSDRDDFEFLEITNISPTENVHLRGLAFVDGITFDFTDSPIGPFLVPGQRALVVKRLEAFEFRYGSGHPVAGEFSGNLSNDGEALALTNADGTTVAALTYNDRPPWPEDADGDGFSLVFTGGGDPADPRHWRPSTSTHGSPGTSDAGPGYDAFKSTHGIASDDDDRDRDGLDALGEYALDGDPDQPDPGRFPTAAFEPVIVGGILDTYLVIRIPRRAGADDITLNAESAGSLSLWHGPSSPDGPVYLGVTKNPDGSETLLFRSALPVTTQTHGFIRARITR